MSIQQKNKGFTIIEVVLVLGIAGLIFLMVFIAYPAVSRGVRDSQRKRDLTLAMAAISNYSNNNRGDLPNLSTPILAANFISSYLTIGGDKFLDPSGANSSDLTATTYTFSANTTLTTYPVSFDAAANQNVIYYATGYTCGTGGAITAAGSRKISLRMALEGGGSTCQSN